MSIKPRNTKPKYSNDAELQRYIKSIQWSDDPKKHIAQLKRLTIELERDLDISDFEYSTNKIYKAEDVRDARKWFKQEIITLLKDPSSTSHKRMSKYTRRQPVMSLPKPGDIGKMFFYGYDPKTKGTLPYYDIFPLILMVRGLDNGWHGLNLHYLPPKQREILILRLMENMSDTRLDNNSRLKLNYKMLSTIAKYRYFKPCFKRYLVSHTRTSVKPVPMRHWAKAILLPTANFKKAGMATVWSDSLKIARGV